MSVIFIFVILAAAIALVGLVVGLVTVLTFVNALGIRSVGRMQIATTAISATQIHEPTTTSTMPM